MSKRPLLLGHRGMGSGEGENTLLSLIRATQVGADGVELDVHQTLDRVIVLTHDSNLKRTLGVDLEIGNVTFKELRKMGLIGPEKLTTIESVYVELPDKAFINVEIKDPRVVETLVPLISSFNALDRTLFSSFHHPCLLKIKKLHEDSLLGLLIGEDARGKDPVAYFAELLTVYKPYSLNLPVQMFEEFGLEKGLGFIKLVRNMGIKVALWTLDDPDLLLKIKDEIDIVITDNLQGIMAALGGKNSRR